MTLIKKHFIVTATTLLSMTTLFPAMVLANTSDDGLHVASVSYPQSTNLLSPDAPLFTVTKNGKEEVFTANKLNAQKSYRITLRMHPSDGMDKEYTMEAVAGVPVDTITKDPGEGIILSGEITDDASPHLDVILGYEQGEHIRKISDEQSFPLTLNQEQKLGNYQINQDKTVEVFATISPLN